jgi:hypothetical protein
VCPAVDQVLIEREMQQNLLGIDIGKVHRNGIGPFAGDTIISLYTTARLPS